MNGPEDVVVSAITTASPEQVWAAWQDINGLRQWWSPAGTTVDSATIELRIGGSFNVVSRGRGLTFEVSGQVTAVQQPHTFTTTWTWTRADTEIAGIPSTVTVTFHEEPDGTTVTVTHHGLPDRVARHRNREGWERALEGLTTYLDG